jgi:predicted aspartyl protease
LEIKQIKQNLKTIISGSISESSIHIAGSIDGGRLVLGSRGQLRFVFNTGFTGIVALQRKYIKRLSARYVGKATTELAEKVIIETDVYLCDVIVKHGKRAMFIENVDIEVIKKGDMLVEFGLLEVIREIYPELLLSMDFQRNIFRILA